MSDVAWSRIQVVKTDEVLRAFAHTLKNLEQDVGDLNRLWPDRAGRDFIDRYLKPLLAHLNRVRDEVRRQLEGLAGAVENLQGAGDALRRLFTLSETVSLAVAEAKSQIKTAQIHLSQSLDVTHTAQSIAESANSILDSL